MTELRSQGSALELRSVAKRYGDFTAVADISLVVPPGEFLTLLGPSGSGKTTTLSMIAGFERVSAGSIHMDGQPIDEVPPYRRKIGVVFQHYALFPHMTAAENVAFPLKQRRVPRAEIRERVGQAMELVKLDVFGDRYPRQLSGGQQQRVALARAIVFNPRVLLMDEPLGALDRNLRESLQLEIKRIHEEVGITVIYVTHDQEEALVLSDRIAVVNNGRIEQVGPGVELYERPQTLFVAQFLGESNIFRGRVDEGAAVITLKGDGYSLKAPGTSSVARGDEAVVVVRPERVHVNGRGRLPSGEENAFSGMVRRVIYLGAWRRLEVELASGELVVARESVASSSGASPGDSVVVSWPTSNGVLLPDTTANGSDAA